ncbi:BspA family leucine-rich repeat surface protein [Psychroserpens sp.]|uniref:BspA family leucine-rich repeat surface protein n=1 Tax=Psychroserpens sp. TaxID=2020870 RepID=UPI001B27D62C|nr:BspA family leucine-rich repeat surface protein [Psychroserpens sp.]MBO6606671.1 BspA family leucine-rich repeat surface protein [Psychroserpens sp.]MBO6631658.1 BspA family leucine-rich repeat surface protein [Psychroserpens sp.]MBO6653375.1 BspA family leucine-rich repeat surface protein [Psychroserpens sp.]MBO6680598.1 BspA family leucine-rich repeat surface protein [Psychroserpens sp.]MBO6750444.1 BspA family leucine-rich repeat surface protein [Psychroserpens sp.]
MTKFLLKLIIIFLFITTSISAQNEFITTWKTDNTGPSSDTEITIPTFSGETYNYDVDWTYDGVTFNTEDSGITGDITHDYGVAGTYIVAIRGTFPRIFFDNDGDREKILTIEQWGNNLWTSMQGAFYGCENLDITNPSIDSPDLSNLTSLAYAFYDCYVFNGDVTGWNVSTVEIFDELFGYCYEFNQDISGWNMSNATSLYYMFYEATLFNQPIGSWNVSSVENMEGLFADAVTFNQALNSWNVSNVTTMDETFYNTLSFNQDLSSWDVSNVEDMAQMFAYADAFNQDLDTWNVSNVNDMEDMFLSTDVFNGNITNWVVSNVTDMNGMFRNSPMFNQDISGWDVGMVTNMDRMFTGADNFDQNLGNWDIGSVVDTGFGSGLRNMFSSSGLSTANYDATLIGWALDSSGVASDGIDDIPTNIQFNAGNSNYCNGAQARATLEAAPNNWTISDQGMSCSTTNYFVTTWKTDNPGSSSDTEITIPTFSGETYNYEVDWTYDGGTFNAESTGVTGDITHDYGVTGTYTVAVRGTFPRIYFNNSDDEAKILTVEQWGTNAWTSMENAFYGCENLNITNGSIDTPNLGAVTNMMNMFNGASSFNANINNWNTENVTNMNSTFEGCGLFNQPLNNWDVSSVTDMFEMFYDAIVFNQDLNSWDVSNVLDMKWMFDNCDDFNGNVSSWNVSNVTDMYGMFSDATSFNQDISNWNVGNVTDMNDMFGQASSFNQYIGNWDVSMVEDMRYMFEDAVAFNQDLSSWDVSSVVTMNNMFEEATSFDQDLSDWDLSSVTTMADMFFGITISLTNYDNMLIAWNTDSSGLDGDGIDDIPNGILFGGGNSVYCNGETSWMNLDTTYGWTITDAGLDCSTLSIDSFNFDEIEVYPNPTSSYIYLQGNFLDLNTVEILNVNGKKVMTLNSNFSSIDIRDLSSGLYFIKLYSQNSFKTIKFIKK